MLSFTPHHRGIISKLYDIILAFCNHSNIKLKCTQEEELGMLIQEESWEEAIERIQSTTSFVRLGLIQLKVLYRVHFLDCLNCVEVEDKCDKLHGSPCHLSHLFFSLSRSVKVSYYQDVLYCCIGSLLNFFLSPGGSKTSCFF